MGIEDVLIQQGGGDDEIEVDFSGVSDSKPLDEGDYLVKVTGCEAAVSAKGNRMLVVSLETVEVRPGWKLKKWAPIEGDGAGIAKNLLKALGEEPGEEGFRVRPKALIGRTAVAEVKFDLRPDKLDDDGNPKWNNVGNFKKAGGGAVTL